MGYTTKFTGEFAITPSPSKAFIEKINSFSSQRHDEKKCPGIWCQWTINSNGKLSWDGGEKFYHYTEWLQYLIDEYFAPQGYELNGKVNYRGERLEDIGVIYIRENSIKQIYGCYDANENELILAVTTSTDGKIEYELM